MAHFLSFLSRSQRHSAVGCCLASSCCRTIANGRVMPLFTMYTRCAATALRCIMLRSSAVETQAFALKNLSALRWRCHAVTFPGSVTNAIAVNTRVSRGRSAILGVETIFARSTRRTRRSWRPKTWRWGR